MIYFELDNIDGLPSGKFTGNLATLQGQGSGLFLEYIALPDDTNITLLFELTEHYRQGHNRVNPCPFCIQCSKLGYTGKGAREQQQGSKATG